jgi:hypothetical protein
MHTIFGVWLGAAVDGKFELLFEVGYANDCYCLARCATGGLTWTAGGCLSLGLSLEDADTVIGPHDKRAGMDTCCRGVQRVRHRPCSSTSVEDAFRAKRVLLLWDYWSRRLNN